MYFRKVGGLLWRQVKQPHISKGSLNLDVLSLCIITLGLHLHVCTHVLHPPFNPLVVVIFFFLCVYHSWVSSAWIWISHITHCLVLVCMLGSTSCGSEPFCSGACYPPQKFQRCPEAYELLELRLVARIFWQGSTGLSHGSVFFLDTAKGHAVLHMN